tara:strand:+ start:355 stop:855 length:501 start_codon:yes stop_codon:yes gene_type:complete
MKVIGVVGWKDTGKTTLIEKLIREFNKRNLTISTIKHSHHNFSVDRQGTDSFRHFNAGAKETILASDAKWIKFSKQVCEHESTLNYLIKQILPVDIVIVEGFKVSGHKKVEVVSSISEKKPLYETDKSICGLIFNKHKIQNISLPQFQRDDIRQICDFIETTIGVE